MKLGLTSFGGPIAHLGYFRDEFVTRRAWLSDKAYADLVALCQFIPGPASSQVGFALGMMRAGWLGALAAFVAFTLPSALALVALAVFAPTLDGPLWQGAVDGLKIVAVAIVAQAVWGMSRALCPDRPRALIALLALALVAFLPATLAMIAAIVIGAGLGLLALSSPPQETSVLTEFPVYKFSSGLALLLFGLLLGAPLVLPLLSPAASLFSDFFRAGSFVFGGGHVVLPLLEAEVVATGRISVEVFTLGYGATQAMPGPLFTFAGYLGALALPGSLWGSGLALLALFLPGFFLLIAALPYWNALRHKPQAQTAMQGANAAVVGILGAALYTPVFTSAILELKDFVLAAICFVALTKGGYGPFKVVLLAVSLSMIMAFF